MPVYKPITELELKLDYLLTQKEQLEKDLKEICEAIKVYESAISVLQKGE